MQEKHSVDGLQPLSRKEPALVVDRSSLVISDANLAASLILNQSSSALLGAQLIEFINVDESGAVRELVIESQRHDEVARGFTTLHSPDGRRFPAEVAVQPYRLDRQELLVLSFRLLAVKDQRWLKNTLTMLQLSEGRFPRAGYRSGRALVVDDEPVVRLVARECLERAGFEVVEAEDGVQAVEQVCSSPGAFDLVLLDLQMPHMGGAACTTMLKQIDPELPILLTTGDFTDDACAILEDLDFEGFLNKPFGVMELIRAVSGILPTHSQRPSDIG